MVRNLHAPGLSANLFKGRNIMQTQTLEYRLLSNHLINDGRYMAKVINQKTIGFENLLKEMENNTALRKEDIRLAITHFMDSIKENLVRGLKVETPLGVFKTSIRGSFGAITEDFRPSADTNNHEVKVRFNPNKNFVEDVISGIAIEKVLENNVKYPKVFEFHNVSAPEDGSLKPFNVISMAGINLKIDSSMEDEGIFWTNSSGEVTKTSVVIQSSNASLLFQVPELSPGSYSLSIATRLGNHVNRSTTLEEPVTIS